MPTKKLNCWELKNCGRELDGDKVDELGTCPAAVSKESDGVNGGVNGGRICWAVAGTLCNGEVQGTFSKKFMNCLQCPVYTKVQEEEERAFVLLPKSEEE